ncbi:MAG: hypothetical protein WB439_09015 [Acidobacteriaceae bacterium]
MRLRNRHLACLLLLLSSLSAADARALRTGDLTLGGRYISSLLIQIQSSAVAVLPEQLAERAAVHPTETFVLAPASRALHAAVWTMRPPAEQTAALQAVTSRLS